MEIQTKTFNETNVVLIYAMNMSIVGDVVNVDDDRRCSFNKP